MLVIFDVDGTLIEGESADWAAFDEALWEVLGFKPDSAFYEAMSEITAQSIAETAIRACGRGTGQGLEEAICAGYFKHLRLAQAAKPTVFSARSGVKELLKNLQADPEVTVAIATGDWFETISFKLHSAGVDIRDIPIATSSDRMRRSDIIRLASERAERPLSEAVYVGDGAWDVRACRELNIPFIGTGTKIEILRDAGALHLHPDFASGSLKETIIAAAKRLPFAPPPLTAE